MTNNDIVDLPFQILYPAIFGTIVYWMVGFNPNFARFLLFLLFIILVSNIGAALGLLIGIIARDTGVAAILLTIFLIPFIIFSGFLINPSDVPVYFIWVLYISFVKWSFQGVAINEV